MEESMDLTMETDGQSGAGTDEGAGGFDAAFAAGFGVDEPERAAGDAEPEEPAPEEPAPEEPEGDGEAKPEDPEDPPGEETESAATTLRLVHGGEEIEVSMEAATALAQRGLEADARVQQAENSPANQLMRRFATLTGCSPDEYITGLEDALLDGMVQQYVAGGATPEAARELLDMKLEQAAGAEEAAAESTRNAQMDGLVQLLEQYPEVETLPPAAVELIGRGVPPLVAYERVLAEDLLLQSEAALKEKEQEVAALKADKKNRSTAPGSAKGFAPQEDSDPFLRGFGAG